MRTSLTVPAVEFCLDPSTISKVVIAFLTAISSAAAVGQVPQAASPAPAIAAAYGKLPLSFEANHGQIDSQVRFLSRGNGYSLFLTDKEAVLALSKRAQRPASGAQTQRLTTDIVRMQLKGASGSLQVAGEDKLPGTANYFVGNNPAKWHSSVPTYAKVSYRNVYPGVDLVYYGNQQQLEYDFVVSPYADPNLIRLHFAGARDVQLGSQGDLRVVGHNGEIAFRHPVFYQEDHGLRSSVHGAFRLLANQTVAFSPGTYDRSKPLIIDPVLSYSTYLGGSGGDFGFGVAIDGQGDAYVTGVTYSNDFPVSATAYGPSTQGTSAPEAFVTKMNSTGTAFVYSTYIGSGDEYGGDGATAIRVDGKGDAYIAGTTYSGDYPVVGGFIQSINNCINAACSNGFVTEVNPTGTNLINSTYIGGGAQGGVGDAVNALFLDSSGNMYLTGSTASVDFPITNGAYQTSNKAAAGGFSTAFIAKLDAAFTSLNYSTFLGGTGSDSGSGIAVDSDGNAYVTGYTYSTNFPVTSAAYQKTNKDAAAKTGYSAFVTKLNALGSALDYSTFLGGSGSTQISGGDTGNGIAIDSSGNATVAGTTTSKDFPTTSGAYQVTNKDSANLGPSCFVSRLNSTADALVYSTFLGGSGVSGYSTGDFCSAVALDTSDNAYMVGTTASKDFPVTSGAVQSVNNDPDYGNVFLTELNSGGSELLYSTFLGGSDKGSPDTPGDAGSALVLDTAGNVYITGKTGSSDFPLTKGAYQTMNNGAASGFDTVFVSKISLGSTASVTVSLSPTSLTFSSTKVGSASANQTVTVTNTGAATLDISGINATGTDASSFYVPSRTCGTSLAAGANCTLSIGFRPKASGTLTGSISITDNAGNSPQSIALTGTGVASPVVKFSVASLSFPSTDVGATSATQAVTLTNTGDATLTIAYIISKGADPSSFFDPSNTCGKSVAAGASCTINIAFRPQASGTLTDTIYVNDNAAGGEQGVNVSGTGIAEPLVTLSPSSLTFASTSVGTTSAAQTVTLKNTGDAVLDISFFSTTGTNASSFSVPSKTCGSTLAVNASCTFNVVFKPTATGALSGDVAIHDNAVNSPQGLKVSGTGK